MGAAFDEIFQDVAQAIKFPTNPEEGWTTFTIGTKAEVETCLVKHRLYQAT